MFTESLPPRVFLLLENPRKNTNLGPILRCAAAFSVSQVVAVGFHKCSTEGSHGASKHVPIIAFPTVEQAALYLRAPMEEGGCGCNRLVGMLSGVAGAFSSFGYPVKQEDGLAQVCVQTHCGDTLLPIQSFPVNTRPFQSGGNVCIVLSKLPRGLPLPLANVCDDFVHVPHSARFLESSNAAFDCLLDTQSCLCITLCHFATWANYAERVFEGHKFEVAKVSKGRVSDTLQASQSRNREQAKLLREGAAEEAINIGCLDGIFASSSIDGDKRGDY
jgi:hypothetical protein